MPRRALHEERGSASLEFLTVGMILLVPLVYLVLAIGAVQSAALGVEGAARHAARVAALHAAGGGANPAGVVDRAVRVSLADYGIDAGATSVGFECDGACDAPGSRIRVRVDAAVALPVVPAVLVSNGIGSVRVGAEATQTVSRVARSAP
ncbi:hypothetical protein GCM10025870_30890 [Agromyces marinus]|uniref:TadE-like protein n=2 Tax=Agromyces marinus TaxID=1389020 RepID=A0ABM8H5C2_9MICO|nr:TadE family protein [Agromyces marinus]BDZ56016.1 hypothetical protein GCM10025870_30890 [Agromyces marinus]